MLPILQSLASATKFYRALDGNQMLELDSLVQSVGTAFLSQLSSIDSRIVTLVSGDGTIEQKIASVIQDPSVIADVLAPGPRAKQTIPSEFVVECPSCKSIFVKENNHGSSS